MSDLDGSYITSLRRAVAELHDGARNLYKKHGDQPNPGSLAQEETHESKSPDSIVIAYSTAKLLLEYNGEHLTTLGRTLAEPIVQLATCTCVRSMLESCALSAWMTDPTIDHKERVSRVFAYRYEGMRHELKLLRARYAQRADLDALEQRIDDVEQNAIELGYAPVQSHKGKGKGKRTGIGQKFPTATENIKRMLDEEVLYRLASGVAHGRFWAITGLAFKPVGAANGVADVAGIRGRHFEKHVSVEAMAYLGLGATRAFAVPLWYLWSYMGWDRVPLTALLNQVFDQLKAKDSERFWRVGGTVKR